jgi:hypothetical protein
MKKCLVLTLALLSLSATAQTSRFEKPCEEKVLAYYPNATLRQHTELVQQCISSSTYEYKKEDAKINKMLLQLSDVADDLARKGVSEKEIGKCDDVLKGVRSNEITVLQLETVGACYDRLRK